MTDLLFKFKHNVENPAPPGYLIVDLETTSNKDGNFRAIDGASPYLVGVLHDATARVLLNCDFNSIIDTKPKVIVGYNIKFDLEHIRRKGGIRVEKAQIGDNEDLLDYIKRKAVVLDTQFITYLASGQTMLFPTLEQSCEYWKVPTRKTLNLVEELEKVEYDISKVPDLVEYLFNDLEMTSALINKILKDPWVISNFSWIIAMHDGFMGTHEIEFNGMHVDPSRLAELTREVKEKYDKTEAELKAATFPEFEPASNDHVAAYLFGGDVEIETRIPNGVYASGKKLGHPRFRIERKTISCPQVTAPLPAWRSAKTGKFSVNEEVLLAVGTPFTDKLLEFRELAKLRGTYLEGLGKHLRIKDGSYYVFPQINTCATATGRTSSSKPNMQNNPTHDSVGVASIYTSRFQESGVLLEVDFKQLEVLALAVLSNDKQLRADIMAGRDIHAETGRPVFGSGMTKEQRRIIKTINFGLIYGGGAATLAAQAKVPKHVAAKAIDSFYRRYPGVREYFDEFKNIVQSELDLHGEFNGYLPNGTMQKIVSFQASTGRRYSFKDYYSDKRKTVEVSHTETRNYPVQGLATGDLVLVALGEVWRKVLAKYQDDVKLVGLVHDSLRFDLKLDKLDELVRDLKCTLEGSGEALNRVCKNDEVWTLPIKVNFSKGTDFFNMKEFEVD